MTSKKATGRAADLASATQLEGVHSPTNTQAIAQFPADFHPVFTTPKQAVQAMRERGARLRILRRDDSIEPGFVFEMSSGSTPADLAKCRAIVRFIKERPPAFYRAFIAAVILFEREARP